MNQKKTQQIGEQVLRMKAGILAFVMGMVFGGIIFIMTAWLLIKGGPYPGYHLRLLGEFFWGYSVTWGGAFIGFFYGALTGGIAGYAIAMIYNRIVQFRFKE